MSDKQNKVVIYSVIGLAIVLIGGGWFFYGSLNTEIVTTEGTDRLQTELEVVRMKTLAADNLKFFDPANSEDSLWNKLDKSRQYDNLNDEAPITFNLNNSGNDSPFLQPARPVVSEE